MRGNSQLLTKETPPRLLAEESVPMTFLRVLGSPYLRATALRCIASIFRFFFIPMHRAAFLPGRIPVSRADHPLDKKIPFMPCKVNTYLDFVAFWIRSLGFLLRTYRRGAMEPARIFLQTMGQVYAWAAEVYRKNLSTTMRPFYIANLRFFIIHLTDPHLMCIPSLHVMVVIRTYTLFREMIRTFGDEEQFARQAEELRRGALAITEAVLYVKQHSVNCVPAAMYAITRFDPRLFPPEEGEGFANDLFRGGEEEIKEEDAGEIRLHILTLYRRFLSYEAAGRDWAEPLLDFLKEIPQG